MPAKALTQAAVDKFKPGATRREIPDAKATGLFLIVQPTGSKSWALRFRRPDGRPAKLSLGSVDHCGKEAKRNPVVGSPLTLASARALAAELHRQRAQGIDIAAEHVARNRRQAAAKEAGSNTFAAQLRRFIDEHARPHTRRWRNTAKLLGLAYPGDGGDPVKIKRGLAQRWCDRDVAAITSSDLYGVVDETRRIGVPGLVRRRSGLSNTQGRAIAAALSKMFSWLLEHRRITSDPSIGLYRPPAPESRERVLSEREIIWFWAACDQLGQPFGSLLKLLLITGGRRDEVAGMTRQELSDDASVWSLPGSRTKNRRPHIVYLPPLARDLIASVPVIESEAGYVFTHTGRRPVSGWSAIKARVDQAMLELAKQEAAGMVPWRLHDLRRSAVTHMAELGIAPHVIERTVNHVSGASAGVAGVYNRSELRAERTAALARWADHLTGIVASKPSNVVPLQQRGT